MFSIVVKWHTKPWSLIKPEIKAFFECFFKCMANTLITILTPLLTLLTDYYTHLHYAKLDFTCAIWDVYLRHCSLRLRSFGVTRIRISDPRSVWIMVHQRNRWNHDQSGFTGSFDAPWSRLILDHWSGSGSRQRNAASVYKLVCM